jgi:hypothetical protein
LTATRDSELVLIEIKFLKPNKDKESGLLKRKGAALGKSRIIKDLEGLFLLSDSCDRLFVIGIHPYVSDNIEVIEGLLSAPKNLTEARKYNRIGFVGGQDGGVRVLVYLVSS